MTVDQRVETVRRVQGELVRKSLQKGEPVRVSLATPSMSPSLLPGDELLVESAGWQQLQLGNIILFERSEALFAHRLIRVQRRTPEICLITKGDATESYDSPVSLESYLGRVTRVVRGGHEIDLEGSRARVGARLRVVRFVLRTMMTRLTHNIQERLGIACVLMIALALFGAATASAAVTISSFGATGSQGQITLSWTTVTENGNFGFNLFRSTDQTTWKQVGTTIPSQSPCISSVTGYPYSYSDNSSDLVLTTTYFYRLQLYGSPCNDPDQYYDRTVSAAPNGGKGPAQPTPTPTSVPPTATPTSVPPTATRTSLPPSATPTAVPPSATPTAVPPTATSTGVPPSATPTGVPQATSTDTPQPQNTAAPTSSAAPTNTTAAIPSPTVRSSGAPRFTPTATLAAGASQPTATAPAATQTPAGGDQPPVAASTDIPSVDAATASPEPTELAMVVSTLTPASQKPQSARPPTQTQPTPAPAATGGLLVGLGLLGVLGMGGAGLMLLGLAGVVLWRFYARG